MYRDSPLAVVLGGKSEKVLLRKFFCAAQKQTPVGKTIFAGPGGVLYTLLMTNFKIALPLISFLLGPSVLAAQCVSFSPGDLKLKWSAYKTPLRQEVEGVFKEVRLKKTSPTKSESAQEFKARDISALLSELEIEIPIDTLSTGITQRDQNIIKYIFNSRPIKARVTSVTKNYLAVEIFMNQKLVRSKLFWEHKNSLLKAHGYIDLIDFALSKELAALTKECFALHEGKTWSDVRLDISVPTKECSR